MQPNRASRGLDKRESVMLRATIWAGHGPPTEHRVRNLSLSGAGIDHNGQLRRGDQVELAIGQAPHVYATVMWIDGDSAGVRFHRPIDLARARKHRLAGHVAHTGWMGQMNDAYRR